MWMQYDTFNDSMNEWSKGFWSESVVLEKYWTDKDYKDVDQERGWWILDFICY